MPGISHIPESLQTASPQHSEEVRQGEPGTAQQPLATQSRVPQQSEARVHTAPPGTPQQERSGPHTDPV